MQEIGHYPLQQKMHDQILQVHQAIHFEIYENKGGISGRVDRWCGWKASYRCNQCEMYGHRVVFVEAYPLLDSPPGILRICKEQRTFN